MLSQTLKDCLNRKREHSSPRVREAIVIGTGGIGVVLGSALARASWKVTMVDVNERKLEAGRRDGIEVNGIRQENLGFTSFAQWTPTDDAILLLCTKTHDNPAVLARIPQRRLLVPIQNSFDPVLNKSSHPFEGITSFVSKREPDRPSARITRKGTLHLGSRRPLVGSERGVLESLAAGLRAGGFKRVRIVNSIGAYKSTKLMYNAAISPLAAAAGIDNEQLLADPVARRLFFALLRENYVILRLSGTRLARIGPFHPAAVDRILSIPPLAQILALLFRRRHSRWRIWRRHGDGLGYRDVPKRFEAGSSGSNDYPRARKRPCCRVASR
jgi:2-dehydropantoate 2-reductase